MEPNTRLKLEELTDAHLQKVIEIYKSLGLICDENPFKRLSADFVKKEIRSFGSLEIRPVISMDIGKMHLEDRLSSDGQTYFHVSIGFNHSFYASQNVDTTKIKEQFDKAMEDEFYDK